MTTDTVIDERTALDALREIEKVERALDDAYQLIADSLHLADRKAVDGYIKARRDTVKAYLDEHGGTLRDGELNVTAERQVRGIAPKYDLVTLAQREGGPEALTEAARAGQLLVDNKALEQFRGSHGAAWADLIFSMREPPGATSALIIKRHGQ